MKKLAHYAAFGVTLTTLVAGGLHAYAMLAANDWIDRCADENSSHYIRDEQRRAAQCAADEVRAQ